MKAVTPNNQTKPENNQDMFDRACERLLRHFDSGRCAIAGRCVYRARADDNGMTCCVVGYVLPDWVGIMPSEVFNGYYVGALQGSLPGFVDWMINVNMDLVRRLQTIHDDEENWFTPSTMHLKLAALASERSLVMKYDKEGVCLTS